MIQDSDLRDAGMIASAQRIEHYEIAVYGTLATWDKQLGLPTILHFAPYSRGEKRADEKPTALAKEVINR